MTDFRDVADEFGKENLRFTGDDSSMARSFGFCPDTNRSNAIEWSKQLPPKSSVPKRRLYRYVPAPPFNCHVFNNVPALLGLSLTLSRDRYRHSVTAAEKTDFPVLET